MKIGARPRGFTIVETLIVLAVSGALLISAATLISGRQAKTEFIAGTRDLQTRFQQVINDVTNGYYPNGGSVPCENLGGVPKVPTSSPKPGDCMFLGKVIQFQVGPGTPDPEVFQVYSVVGVRENGGSLVPSIDKANPRLITTAGLFDKQSLPYGMTTKSVTINNTTPIGAIGFLSSIGYIDSTGVVQGPSQQVDVYPVPGTALGQDQSNGVACIEHDIVKCPVGGAGLVNAKPNPTGGVQVCVASGGTDQLALYTFGGQGKQLTVSVDIKNGTNCT